MKIVDLPVEKREKFGSSHARRYRRSGRIPCILYGDKQESIPLCATVEAFDAILKGHTALVRLQLGKEEQTALIREVTWDTFGEHVEHVDFVRVEMKDEVKVTVPIHFKGIPAGASEGGETQKTVTDLSVFARVDAIPSEIVVDISGLKIHDGIHVGELALPPNVRHALQENVLVVHVVPPRKVEEPVTDELAAVEGAPAEGEAAEDEAADKDKDKEKDKEKGRGRDREKS